MIALFGFYWYTNRKTITDETTRFIAFGLIASIIYWLLMFVIVL